ncbi:Homeodomain-like DNA binding domain-containing transcription factor [Phycomyces blakesleeanus NRRL 1555(-)]|uniref:Homeodomain-like DNA binding domain-containing transcription factor n=1 Tax=Phycomyces blakesleeanus (strain ATCC 8743b / DSM 1359 / FGSC 10004 / NBRC 33097 / NRRL 1555) TaxID=763407 RepID=A0A162UGJ8_PHYB8|nr:Homeodomain-like DNA binding domain-containing transcription factor [Phycomyces blakesleeanus NRRL 1555(-)]OAD76072.1 Homeodomain-like DNA binding domain-containing transcription factor [Phycomyces blakesleeanus NRRL 1555(-)]|eukprot:XP_018294112.1 Homeodomain-like DNA binding domain-containing transcription factor [Phycomyces blakesleeanus NRRL 1555(-)]
MTTVMYEIKIRYKINNYTPTIKIIDEPHFSCCFFYNILYLSLPYTFTSNLTTNVEKRELSDFEYEGIVWLSKANHTLTDIANRMNIPRTIVFNTIKRWETTETAKTKTRPERPKKLSVTNITSLCLSVRCNPFESYRYHQANLGAAGVIVCRQTVIRYL